MSCMLPVHATASGGLPDMDPIGSPIAGSAKTDRIHQGFQQQGTTPVASLPVARHLPRAQRQNLAGQSFDSYPWKDQKPAVVDDRLQMEPPLLVAPAERRLQLRSNSIAVRFGAGELDSEPMAGR